MARHQYLTAVYEMQADPRLDFVPRLQPPGFDDTYWNHLQEYLKKQKEAGKIIRWINSKIDTYKRALERMPTTESPKVPTPEEIKRHNKVILQVLTEFVKFDMLGRKMQTTEEQKPRLALRAAKTARVLYQKYQIFCQENQAKLNIADENLTMDAFDEFCQQVGWERRYEDVEPARKRRKKKSARELRAEGKEEEARAVEEKKRRKNTRRRECRRKLSKPWQLTPAEYNRELDEAERSDEETEEGSMSVSDTDIARAVRLSNEQFARESKSTEDVDAHSGGDCCNLGSGLAEAVESAPVTDEVVLPGDSQKENAQAAELGPREGANDEMYSAIFEAKRTVALFEACEMDRNELEKLHAQADRNLSNYFGDPRYDPSITYNPSQSQIDINKQPHWLFCDRWY